ncbi:MAG: PepSY domain-containing protein [Candidatus Competibacterales bacterium]|nr:PepSY domain-containing protein [Candidatus Competibacterales bacterium]
MNPLTRCTAALLLAAASTLALAVEGTISKEQAIEMALQAHPGQVEKAYRETKRGAETWEVKIKGDDGYEWEVYYAVADGALVKEEREDD